MPQCQAPLDIIHFLCHLQSYPFPCMQWNRTPAYNLKKCGKIFDKSRCYIVQMIKFECASVIHHWISFTLDVIYRPALFPACSEKGLLHITWKNVGKYLTRAGVMIKFECPRVIHHLISFTFDVIYVAALFPACCEKGPMDLSLMLFSVLIFAMVFSPKYPVTRAKRAYLHRQKYSRSTLRFGNFTLALINHTECTKPKLCRARASSVANWEILWNS